MRQFILGTVFGLSCALALPAAQAALDPTTAKELDRLAEALERVQFNYIRPIGVRELVDNAISGIMQGLDRHSSYIPPDVYAAMTSGAADNDEVGFSLRIDNGLPVIVTVYGADAQTGGLKTGDRVVAVAGQPTDNLTLENVTRMLRGPQGSTVVVSARRTAGQPPFNVTVARNSVYAQTIRAEAHGAVGYIRIPAIDENTPSLLRDALSALRKTIGPGIKGYVIDLRDNPGGLLTETITLGDMLLDKGRIVSQHGRTKDANQDYDARPGDEAQGLPIVVLTNEVTASGAEIVAAALQDDHRATIVGTKTFGNGSIQTIIPIPGGGALRLTTSEFTAPSGRAIEGAGVLPDIVVPDGPGAKGVADGQLQVALDRLNATAR